MADDTVSSDFYWNNVVIKVEDKLFCVPLCEFVKSSEVFADMFLLPSGPETRSEGQDKEHPIVLEGYKKDEFACLLRVMYPTAGSLISDNKLDLGLKKEEWVSVLKLSTIWDMKKIREYAIHILSTGTLSPIEKIRLARVARVSGWLKEAITTLTSSDHKPALEDLVTLGWETAARILWIREISRHSPPDTMHFIRDAIKCWHCQSSLSLINSNSGCGHVESADAELFCPGTGSAMAGTADRAVRLRLIQCKTCRGTPFNSVKLYCRSSSCSRCHDGGYPHIEVRITPFKAFEPEKMIEEMFGEEIKDYRDKPATTT